MFLLMAVLCHIASYSQSVQRFYLSINDAHYLPMVRPQSGHLRLDFEQAALNSIQARYTIYGFNQAFPRSRYEMLRRVYYVEANSLQLMYDLMNYSAKAYPHGEQIYQIKTAGNEPDDYSVNNQYIGFGYEIPALRIIGALNAWKDCVGIDSTHTPYEPVTIGMVDRWVDVNQPDLKGKFKRIRSNVMGTPAVYHGTQVAGLIAANTNNGMGISSIGYNCNLDLSTNTNQPDGEFLNMALDGVRVTNGSILYDGGCTNDTDYNDQYLIRENIYNEIYENGTTAVFAGGNGDGLCSSSSYAFPASFNHNISVTGVGTSVNHSYRTQDCFVFNTPEQVFNYNRRVDMAAPGWDNVTTDTGNHYTTTFDGTSGAAPLVTGTVGLMIAAKPCLSPYQVEYLLKTTGFNIDNIPNNIPYAGKIGKRLNAGAALEQTKFFFNCNDPATQTMYIDAIGINTICAPGSSSNGVKPQFTPHVVNGNGTLKYHWEPVPGNAAILDDYNIANPTITSINTLAGTDTFYFQLTVYDGSMVQKVASRFVKGRLKFSGYDLAMQDAGLDMMDEPSSMTNVDLTNWQIWQSPDIWNRRTADGVREHENPEYFKNGDPNYMYVRIRNIGCAASPSDAVARLYWTLFSTGEQWPADWTTRQLPAAAGGTLAAGGEITPQAGISIPVLNPGDTFVTNHEWYPKKPEDYLNGGTEVEVCGLARIVEPSAAQEGMYATEVNRTTTNVHNNNNVVTRNFILVNLGHRGTNRPDLHHIFVGNGERVALATRLELITDKDVHRHLAGNLSEFVYAKVDLGGLYDRWAAAGKKGNYASADDEGKTVLYDPSTPLSLEGIVLNPGEMLPVNISFVLRDGVAVPFDVPMQQVHFRQFMVEEGKGEMLYGNVSFGLQIAMDDDARPQSRGMSSTGTGYEIASRYSVYPNPVSGMLSIVDGDVQRGAKTLFELTDVTGKVLISKELTNSKESVNVSQLASGIYLYRMVSDGCVTGKGKVVKE